MLPEEIQRLVNDGNVSYRGLRHVAAVKFEGVFRIFPQEHRVHPPGIVPDVLFDHRIGDVLINRTAVPDILSAD